jgi:DNA-directed RNA polymerase specialized sigma24 family protein
VNQTCVPDRPAPGNFVSAIEASDFLAVHLPRLSEERRTTVLAWASGRTCQEISVEAGVSESAVKKRLQRGLRQLRQLAGANVH